MNSIRNFEVGVLSNEVVHNIFRKLLDFILIQVAAIVLVICYESLVNRLDVLGESMNFSCFTIFAPMFAANITKGAFKKSLIWLTH